LECKVQKHSLQLQDLQELELALDCNSNMELRACSFEAFTHQGFPINVLDPEPCCASRIEAGKALGI
jgi:hypothetical protein